MSHSNNWTADLSPLFGRKVEIVVWEHGHQGEREAGVDVNDVNWHARYLIDPKDAHEIGSSLVKVSRALKAGALLANDSFTARSGG